MGSIFGLSVKVLNLKTSDMTIKFKPDLKPIKQEKSNPHYIKKGKKATGELELFMRLWEDRTHVSFLSGIPLGEFNVSLFAHVLSKKQYSNFRLFDKNIILLTEYEHHILEQGTMDSRARYQQEVREMGYDCDWLCITDLADKLKKEYK